MKKIAILTLPLGENYGGILQNYSLQIVLKDLGFSPITVDRHRPRKITSVIRAGYFKLLLRHFIMGEKMPVFRHHFLSRKDWVYIRRNIEEFITRNLSVTPRLYSDREVKKVFERCRFSAVVVGSDQVWRPRYSPSLYMYYLDFLRKNDAVDIISYAASFGADEWEYSANQTARCKQLIKAFDSVSMREKSAVLYIEEMFGRGAELVLDPTLLLPKEHYISLFSRKKIADRSGLLTYILDSADWKDEVVDATSKKLNKPSFNSQPRAQLFRSDSKNIEDYKFPSIEKWLKSFADADFVVTDSFHGMVFSIIFNKPFVVLLNQQRGASRFHSLLELLGLTERLIKADEVDRIEELITSQIDYLSVNTTINLLRDKSLSFLKRSLAKE